MLRRGGLSLQLRRRRRLRLLLLWRKVRARCPLLRRRDGLCLQQRRRRRLRFLPLWRKGRARWPLLRRRVGLLEVLLGRRSRRALAGGRGEQLHLRPAHRPGTAHLRLGGRGLGTGCLIGRIRRRPSGAPEGVPPVRRSGIAWCCSRPRRSATPSNIVETDIAEGVLRRSLPSLLRPLPPPLFPLRVRAPPTSARRPPPAIAILTRCCRCCRGGGSGPRVGSARVQE
mmetsp:Transcript_64548/g.185637  ORF Transcript_64548/g.185637 Transcript_64548/m.185637 type:complete len:227 (+) Transcript_64548:363-1043(+)